MGVTVTKSSAEESEGVGGWGQASRLRQSCRKWYDMQQLTFKPPCPSCQSHWQQRAARHCARGNATRCIALSSRCLCGYPVCPRTPQACARKRQGRVAAAAVAVSVFFVPALPLKTHCTCRALPRLVSYVAHLARNADRQLPHTLPAGGSLSASLGRRSLLLASVSHAKVARQTPTQGATTGTEPVQSLTLNALTPCQGGSKLSRCYAL